MGWTATLASAPKNGSVLLKDKDMGAANSNASVVHKSTKRDKPTGMKEAQLVIAPLKRTSAVRMPSAGERCVIVRGRRPDLIGRLVTVDEVLKSKNAMSTTLREERGRKYEDFN